MKPLSAHNICESLNILGLLYFYGLSNEKSVFGFENSFSNFSSGKTHPKQLSFDAGIKTFDDLECCVHNSHVVYVCIVCVVMSYWKCM